MKIVCISEGIVGVNFADLLVSRFEAEGIKYVLLQVGESKSIDELRSVLKRARDSVDRQTVVLDRFPDSAFGLLDSDVYYGVSIGKHCREASLSIMDRDWNVVEGAVSTVVKAVMPADFRSIAVAYVNGLQDLLESNDDDSLVYGIDSTIKALEDLKNSLVEKDVPVREQNAESELKQSIESGLKPMFDFFDMLG